MKIIYQSESMLSLVRRGLRHTTVKEVAIQVGRETGRPPIEFISPKLRDLYLRVWPELGETK